MMRALLLALVIGSLAFAAGYLTGRHPPPQPPLTAPVVAAPPREIVPLEPPPAVFAVELIGADARRGETITGIALGVRHRLILPLVAMPEVQAALAHTPNGRVPVGPVVGVLPSARLIALAGPEGKLAVSVEPASLPLGLSVLALERGRSVRGQVESTAERREDGSYAYRVRLTQPLASAFAAVADESGTTLLGAITGAGAEENVYTAVDAGALQTLAAGNVAPQQIEPFAREFFEDEPAGRLITFERAAAAGDWTTAIELGRELMNLGWSYRDAVAAPLAQAYLEAARAAHEQPERALALLDDAAIALGDEAVSQSSYAPYHAALGRLQHAQGRYIEAAANLERALAEDPSLEPELSSLLANAQQRLRTPAETVVPLHATDSGLYIYATVGGRRMRLVLDTGATYTALSAEAARSIGLESFVEAQRVLLATAGGHVNAPLVTLRSIDVNGAVVQQVPVVILDTTVPFEGLLGMSFLDHFDVSIDRRGNNVRLVRR